MTILHISKKTKATGFDKRIWNVVTMLRTEERQLHRLVQRLKDKPAQKLLTAVAATCSDCAVQLITQWDKIYTTECGESALYEKTPTKKNNDDFYDRLHLNGGDIEILSRCWRKEKEIRSCYQILLNDPMLAQDRRKLLRQQLNKLLCAFVQLKMACYPIVEYPAYKYLIL